MIRIKVSAGKAPQSPHSLFKRVFVLLLCCMVLMPSLAAHADIIVEPDNDFYAEHQDQMTQLNRSFVALEGGAYVLEAPDSLSEIAWIPEGESVFLDFSCLYEGAYWGFSQNDNGWVNINELEVLYDYISFEEEHLSEFYPYEGTYDTIRETQSAIAWAWPGSGDPLFTLEDLDADSFSVAHAYQDSDGREWGFVGYYHANRNFWVCLSDPVNRDIPAFNPAGEAQVWESDTTLEEIPASSPWILILIVVLVAVLALVTAILIAVFFRKKDGKQENRR